MNRRSILCAAAMTLLLPIGTQTQARPSLAGAWVYQQARSTPDPAVGFPTEIEIKETATGITLVGSSNHQDSFTAVYSFDGSETTFEGSGGMTTAKASWEGGKLVAHTRRSYRGPQGEITVETKETYGLEGGTLTVERTQTVGGRSNTGITTYTKAS